MKTFRDASWQTTRVAQVLDVETLRNETRRLLRIRGLPPELREKTTAG